MESSQTAADLQLHLEKYHSQLREVQVAVTDKTTALEQQSFKYRRIVVSYNSGLSFYTLSLLPKPLSTLNCSSAVSPISVALFLYHVSNSRKLVFLISPEDDICATRPSRGWPTVF